MDHGGSAAQFLEMDNKSPCYIELSASPALVPVCIGCSLSLQLSAWGGTVNDVFVLRSPFVLSWFLEQHKQAWNLFYPPRKKNGRHPSLPVHNPALRTGESEFDLCFSGTALSFGRFYFHLKKGHFSLIELSCRIPVNCEFTCSSHGLSDNRSTQSLSKDKHVNVCQWSAVGLLQRRGG